MTLSHFCRLYIEKNCEIIIGFGDIDLIFGDIQTYLEPVLDKTDVFSAHADRIAGHFFFMRNMPKYIQKCFQIRNWQDYLSRPENLGIDEGAFCDVICPILGLERRLWHRLAKNMDFARAWNLLLRLNRIFGIFKSPRMRFVELHSTHSAISPNVLEYEWSDTEWIYDGKKITGRNNNRQYPYLHFLFLKTVKEVPVTPTWQAGFYRVADVDAPVIISRTTICNL